MKYRVIRELTKLEKYGATDRISKGDIVYRFDGCTYGCIGDGIACSRKLGENPFFEMPKDSLEQIV